MMKVTTGFRVILCATTALSLGAGIAHAQTPQTTQPLNLNLGSVIATGTAGGGNVAPSATGTAKQAKQLEKLAPNVITVVPASEIKKHPDANIADALNRLPGVAVTSDSGEGQFISIRGMNPDLNGTTFDGIHLTANDQGAPMNGERAPDIAVFPTGIVGGAEVVKSLTPDMDAEGLGGSANILPISLPENGGYMANINVAAGDETLHNKGLFQGSIQLGGSFAIPGLNFANAKPFSVIFAYANYTDSRGIDDVEEAYDDVTETANHNNADLDNLQFRDYQEHRTRQGMYGEFDFNPTAQTGFFFRALRTGYSVDIDKDRLELSNLDASDPTGSNGDFTVDGAKSSLQFTHVKEDVLTDVLELGGHSVIDNTVNVDGTASYTQGSEVEPYDYVTKFKGPKININYDVDNTEYRSYTILNGVDLSDAANYSMPAGDMTDKSELLLDQEWATALNASFANNPFDGSGVAKFGADVRLRSEGDSQQNYENAAAGPDLNLVDGTNQPFNYYNGHYTLPPWVDYSELLPAVPLEGTSADMIAANEAAYQHDSENVYAAYGQETIQFGKVELLGGVRVEDTNGSYGAYQEDSTGTVTGYGTNHQDYINLFPSAQFKYTVDPQLQFRAAYSTAIARPGFTQISSATTVSVGGAPDGDNLVTEGNPNLKPTYVNSFDLTAEYDGDHNAFTINPFYKLFNNYVINTGSYGTYQGQPATFSTFQNISGAFSRGVEIDGQQRFAFLPSPFDGLGIDGNITFVDSNGRSDGPQYKAYQLPETSPISYNATLSYVKGPFDAEVSVNYVSRSLFQVIAAPSDAVYTNPRDWDTFTAARTTVDANLFYTITPRVTAYFQARNLTNSPLEFTQSASAQYPIQREFYDADYIAGVSFKLGS